MGKKYDKRHLKQNNLHGGFGFWKSAQKMIKIRTPRHTPILSSHQWVKRYIDKDCLIILLIYARQKIKFNRYLTNQFYQCLGNRIIAPRIIALQTIALRIMAPWTIAPQIIFSRIIASQIIALRIVAPRTIGPQIIFPRTIVSRTIALCETIFYLMNIAYCIILLFLMGYCYICVIWYVLGFKIHFTVLSSK